MAASPQYQEAGRTVGESNLGRELTEQHRAQLRGREPWNKGIKTGIAPWLGKVRGPQSLDTRRKRSLSLRRAYREGRHPQWKGGSTAKLTALRHSLRYKLWREQVFQRDDHTCQHCGERGGKLQADHIRPFAFYPALRFDVSNGRTLCISCHMKTESYLNRYYKPTTA